MSEIAEIVNKKPEGGQVFIDGIWYKQGLHDLIFRWNNEEWVKSNLDPATFHRALRGNLRTGAWRRSATLHANNRSTQNFGKKQLSDRASPEDAE